MQAEQRQAHRSGSSDARACRFRSAAAPSRLSGVNAHTLLREQKALHRVADPPESSPEYTGLALQSPEKTELALQAPLHSADFKYENEIIHCFGLSLPPVPHFSSTDGKAKKVELLAPKAKTIEK